MLQEIRKLGFPGAELGSELQDYHWEGVQRAADKHVIRLVSLSLRFTDWSDISKSTKAFERAQRLGVPHIILEPEWPRTTRTTAHLLRLYKRGHFLERDFVQHKVTAVKLRPRLVASKSGEWTRVISDLVKRATTYKLRLAVETSAVFESFPQENELSQLFGDFPPELLGYWHDFGHAARKDFLAWHTHGESLADQRERLVGYHVHDCRRPDEDHLPLSHGDVEFSTLLPLTKGAVAVLELGPKTPDEQVLSSRHLWHSYVDTSA
jgi:sugar phosphate isomerase/epimerase